MRGSPAPTASLPKAPGTARPRASTWGSTTVSFLGTAAAAGVALPCSRALSAAAAPKLPPPLGSAGSPVQPLVTMKHACILYQMHQSMRRQQAAMTTPYRLLRRSCSKDMGLGSCMRSVLTMQAGLQRCRSSMVTGCGARLRDAIHMLCGSVLQNNASALKHLIIRGCHIQLCHLIRPEAAALLGIYSWSSL